MQPSKTDEQNQNHKSSPFSSRIAAANPTATADWRLQHRTRATMLLVMLKDVLPLLRYVHLQPACCCCRFKLCKRGFRCRSHSSHCTHMLVPDRLHRHQQHGILQRAGCPRVGTPQHVTLRELCQPFKHARVNKVRKRQRQQQRFALTVEMLSAVKAMPACLLPLLNANDVIKTSHTPFNRRPTRHTSSLLSPTC